MVSDHSANLFPFLLSSYYYNHFSSSSFLPFADWDAAGDAKEKANEAKANGDYETALSKFTEAMTIGSVSAMVLANRADVLMKLKRPCAAISDCSAAIDINPDSAKALR